MSVQFTDLSYSPEMMMAMLSVQKAEARLDARSKVVEGAVAITHDAITRLGAEGIDLEKSDRNSLANSLMSLTCSDDGNVQAIMRII